MVVFRATVFHLTPGDWVFVGIYMHALGSAPFVRRRLFLYLFLLLFSFCSVCDPRHDSAVEKLDGKEFKTIPIQIA